MKLFHPHNFSAGVLERISPDVKIGVNGKIHFGKRCSIHSGCKISSGKGADLYLGDHVYMGYDVLVVCRDSITIGDGTEIGPRVIFYDHDHDFRCEGGIHANQYKTTPITVGKDCWIGANSIILRGVTIGDRAVIGAGSVITKDVEADAVIVQKRKNWLCDG